jgi:hypothetical protein
MKKMAISYMVSNGNGFYLQKRIPKDLLPHYPDCRSGLIKRYLDTDLAEAKRKLAIGLAQLEEEWATKRKGGGSASELADKEIERLTAIWLHNPVDEDEHKPSISRRASMATPWRRAGSTPSKTTWTIA